MGMIKLLFAPIRSIVRFPLFQLAIVVAVILFLQSADENSAFGQIFNGLDKLDERFHENDPMGFDPTFVIPGCVPAGDSRSERRPGIHSPCGGYGFRARLSRASRVTRAPE
jgi:hypothetical protein